MLYYSHRYAHNGLFTASSVLSLELAIDDAVFLLRCLLPCERYFFPIREPRTSFRQSLGLHEVPASHSNSVRGSVAIAVLDSISARGQSTYHSGSGCWRPGFIYHRLELLQKLRKTKCERTALQGRLFKVLLEYYQMSWHSCLFDLFLFFANVKM